MKMTKNETSVEIITNGLKNIIKNQNLTPEQMQTIHLSNISIMLAALDDDMKELIKVLKKEEKN